MGSNCCKCANDKKNKHLTSASSNSSGPWSRGDVELPEERFSSVTQRGAVTLNVRNATVDDSGRYSLSARNDAGHAHSDLLLEVRTRPGDVPVFLRRLNDLAVKVGTRTRFLVEIRSPTQVKVSWEQEGKPVVESERFHLLHEGNFFCVDVAPVTLGDAGLWICRAHNSNGTATCFCHLNVLVPKAYKAPHFIEELVAILTEQGTVSLECKVVGVPTPTLKWFKDNQEIKAGDVFALSANPQDTTSLGTYTCEATNCMGHAYSTSRVHVLGKEGSVQPVDSIVPKGPAPVFSKELRNEKVKIGGKMTLSCKVSVPPWPKSIAWFNKAGMVESGGRYHVVEDGLGAYSVEVDPVEAGDEGEWKCVATSDHGVKGISSCNVSVSYPKNYKKPKFLESLKAILTEEGLVSFECKVVGYPTPQLRWFKDGQELKPGDVYQLTGTNSLGSYCCIAKNCMGETSSTAELTVEDIQSQLNEEERLQLFSKNQPPRFLQGLKSLEAKIMDPLRFTVQVSVSPQPSVAWYRDDEEVQESDRYKKEQETKGFCHLTIKRLELMDQAEWKCVATNDYGQSVTSCFLKLAVPRHYKKPRFLENLRAVLSEEGAVNLECKVIGVPQPTLKWYKDGRELKPGDIHRIISGQDGTCCLGTYTCEATNCMGTVASSASLLGFEDRAQVKPQPEPLRPLPPPAAHLTRHPSLSTILEERTSQLHDTVASDERAEVSFSFDGKEVSVSLYETPDLTEEEALQVVEMYAEELSEHISGLQEVKTLEHNVVELPPMRFVKETSHSGHLLMEAVVIDVSPEYYTSAEDRTEADLDEFSITEDNNGFMSPQVLTPEEMPFEKFTADFLERTVQLGQKAVPVKPPRKRGADNSESSYHSLKEAKLSPEEESSEFADALSSIKDKSQKDSFGSAKSGAEGSGEKPAGKKETEQDLRKSIDHSLQENDNKLPETKKSRKKSRSRSRSAEIQSIENVSDTAVENKVPKRPLKKRKSTDSEKEDDSLREFERQKSLKADTDLNKEFEKSQQKDIIKKGKSSESEKEDDSLQEFESRKSLHRSETKPVTKSKALQKKQMSDSSGREDDSLIEYEKKKVSSDGISEKTSLKSEKQDRHKAPLSKSISTDSSEKDEAFAIKSEQSEQLRKRKKRSIKKSGSTEKKTETPETGVEILPSSEAESCDRDSLKNKKVVSTSDLDRMRSTSDLDSIGDKSRAQEEEEHSVDFDTAEDSAYDKSEMSVLESLTHSIKEIKKGLAAVEERVISESTDEPQTAKSSLSAIESLVQPINEIQRGLFQVEKLAEESEAGQYSPSSILETLKEPIEELGRNLAVIEKAKSAEVGDESLLRKTSQTLLETMSHPLQELQKELNFIQQQAIIETGEETFSDVLQSFKPSLLVVQGGVEQTEGDFTSKIEDLTDVTVLPQGTYAQQTEQTPRSLDEMMGQQTMEVKHNDLFVPSTVHDLEESFAETAVSLTALGAFDLHNELEAFSEKLKKCLKVLNKNAEDTTDDEVKDILISLGKLVTPLEQFKSVIEKCLKLVDENDRSNDAQVRSSNMVLKATLESPVHALGKCLHLLEAVANSKSSKEIRGLGIKTLYKLSFPLEELKTTMKLIENLSEHTSIELLVTPVENLICAASVINLEASKSGFAENISEEGGFIVRELDDTVGVLSNSVASMTKALSSQSSLRTLSSLTKPLADFQKNLHKIEHKIRTQETYNTVSTSEIFNLAQDLCKPLQAIRTELSIAQHEIELDQYSHLSLLSDPIQANIMEFATNLIHQSLEQVHKSVLTCTEFILSKSPSETLYVRYLLFALNEVILPLNQLNTNVLKARELISKEVQTTPEPNIGISAVASSAGELLKVLSDLHHHSLTSVGHSEIQMVQLLCTMEEPLIQVERGLCKIIEHTHEEDKKILNINMLKTLAEPFKCLQKSLINIYEKLGCEPISQEVFLELRHPIQELQRSILIIQDQVSFEYGDEPASIESNIVTLQSLVNPLNALKKQFMDLDNIVIDQTQSTSYSKENKNLHSIIKVNHDLQLKISSIMVEENYLNKHSLDSLDMFPVFQDLASLFRDFENTLRRVDLVCLNEAKPDIIVHNKLCEAVKAFTDEAADFHNRIILASNKANKDVKHPVHFLKRGTETFFSRFAEIMSDLEHCPLDETSLISCSSKFYQEMLLNFKDFSDFIKEMEKVNEELAKDSPEMSLLSSSDTIKDVNTIMEEVTQTRVSLESVNILSSTPTALEKARKELKTFCEILKSTENSIIDNTITKANSSSFDREGERRTLLHAFGSMVEQLHKIESCVTGNQEAMESVNYLKNTIEVIQEHLNFGEEISEVYILQNLSVPLKKFKDNISKAFDTISVKTEEPPSVSSYLERFEKSASDLELGLMKLEHALLNSTGDFSSLKNIDIDVIAHPIEELGRYINSIEEQQTGFDSSETLVDQSSLSMLKTLAQPIREIHEGVLQIQEQIALEASGKTPSGKSCAGILYEIAKPIRELRSGVALIQEQMVMEPDVEPLSEETRASSIQTFAVPLQEMKKVLTTIIEQQPLIFEADVQSMSENISLLKTIAQPVKELQNKLASTEINQIMESGVEPFSVKENILALAKPVQTLQEGIAWVESQLALETTGDDVSCQNSIAMLKQIAEPLLEICKGIAVISEQQFIEEGNLEDAASISEFSTLANITDVSLADAAVHIGETVALEHGQSFQADLLEPQLAKRKIEDNLKLGIIEQQQVLLDVDSQTKHQEESAVKLEKLDAANLTFVQGANSSVQVQEQEVLSQEKTLSVSEERTPQIAELTEVSHNLGVQAEFQDAVVDLENFVIEMQVEESAVMKNASLNIAAQVEVQEALSNVKSLTSSEDLQLTEIEPDTLTPCIVQGELQQSLADVESLETEEDTLESISIQDTSFKFEPHINEIQQALSNVENLTIRKETPCEAEIKADARQSVQNETLQTLDKEALLESLDRSSEQANISVTMPNIAAETEMQQIVSNVDDIKAIQNPNETANIGEVSLQSAFQVECQQVLSNVESLETELLPEKQSQVLALEESHKEVAIKTEVQEFISVLEQIEAVKNELQVKVTQEPLLHESVKQEIKQVLQVAEDIISLREDIQAKSTNEPNVNVELPDIKQVLTTCEKVMILQDIQKEKSQEMPEIQKDIENILSLALSLDKAKEGHPAPIPEESDQKVGSLTEIKSPTTDIQGKISECEPVAILFSKLDSKVQEDELPSADQNLSCNVPSTEESIVKKAIATQLQQFITAVDEVSYSIKTLEVKLNSDPVINHAVQQELQEILSSISYIETVKNTLQTPSKQEESFKLSSQVEIQQVLLACNSFENLKEALEAKLSKELKIYSAVQSELQQILLTGDAFQTIKETLNANVIELEPLDGTASIEFQKVISSNKSDMITEIRQEDLIQKAESDQIKRDNEDSTAELKISGKLKVNDSKDSIEKCEIKTDLEMCHKPVTTKPLEGDAIEEGKETKAELEIAETPEKAILLKSDEIKKGSEGKDLKESIDIKTDKKSEHKNQVADTKGKYEGELEPSDTIKAQIKSAEKIEEMQKLGDDKGKIENKNIKLEESKETHKTEKSIDNLEIEENVEFKGQPEVNNQESCKVIDNDETTKTKEIRKPDNETKTSTKVAQETDVKTMSVAEDNNVMTSEIKPATKLEIKPKKVKANIEKEHKEDGAAMIKQPEISKLEDDKDNKKEEIQAKSESNKKKSKELTQLDEMEQSPADDMSVEMKTDSEHQNIQLKVKEEIENKSDMRKEIETLEEKDKFTIKKEKPDIKSAEIDEFEAAKDAVISEQVKDNIPGYEAAKIEIEKEKEPKVAHKKKDSSNSKVTVSKVTGYNEVTDEEVKNEEIPESVIENSTEKIYVVKDDGTKTEAKQAEETTVKGVKETKDKVYVKPRLEELDKDEKPNDVEKTDIKKKVIGGEENVLRETTAGENSALDDRSVSKEKEESKAESLISKKSTGKGDSFKAKEVKEENSDSKIIVEKEKKGDIYPGKTDSKKINENKSENKVQDEKENKKDAIYSDKTEGHEKVMKAKNKQIEDVKEKEIIEKPKLEIKEVTEQEKLKKEIEVQSNKEIEPTDIAMKNQNEIKEKHDKKKTEDSEDNKKNDIRVVKKISVEEKIEMVRDSKITEDIQESIYSDKTEGHEKVMKAKNKQIEDVKEKEIIEKPKLEIKEVTEQEKLKKEIEVQSNKEIEPTDIAMKNQNEIKEKHDKKKTEDSEDNKKNDICVVKKISVEEKIEMVRDSKITKKSETQEVNNEKIDEVKTKIENVIELNISTETKTANDEITQKVVNEINKEKEPESKENKGSENKETKDNSKIEHKREDETVLSIKIKGSEQETAVFDKENEETKEKIEPEESNSKKIKETKGKDDINRRTKRMASNEVSNVDNIVAGKAEVKELPAIKVAKEKVEVITDSKAAKQEDGTAINDKDRKQEEGTKSVSKMSGGMEIKTKEEIKETNLKKDEEAKDSLEVNIITNVTDSTKIKKVEKEDEIGKAKDEKLNVRTGSKAAEKEDNTDIKDKEVKTSKDKVSKKKEVTKKVGETAIETEIKIEQEPKFTKSKIDEESKKSLTINVEKTVTDSSESENKEKDEVSKEKNEKVNKIKEEAKSESEATKKSGISTSQEERGIKKLNEKCVEEKEDTRSKSSTGKQEEAKQDELYDKLEGKISLESDVTKIKDDEGNNTNEQIKPELIVTKKTDVKKGKKEVDVKIEMDEKLVKESNEIKPNEKVSNTSKTELDKKDGSKKVKTSDSGMDNAQVKVDEIKGNKDISTVNKNKSKKDAIVKEVETASEVKVKDMQTESTQGHLRIGEADDLKVKIGQECEIEKYIVEKTVDTQDKSPKRETTMVENQESSNKIRLSKKQKDKSVLDESKKDIQRKHVSADSKVEEKLLIVEKEEDTHKLYIDESSTSDYGSESYSEPHQIKKSQSYDTRAWVCDSKSRTEEITSKVASKGVRERKYEALGSAEQEKITYTHRQSASKPVFCGRLVDRTAAQGSRLKVTCSLSGSPDPTVQWFKDGHLVDTNFDHRVRTRLSNGLASLEIVEAKVGDSGKYTCTARNSHGEASTTASIKVFSYLESAPEAPVFTQHIRDHYKSSSDELVIECRVKGHPQPTVSWTKDGQSMRPLARYEQSVQTDGTCRLVIHGPEAADSGLYQCQAENAVWSEQTSACVMFEGREKYIAESRSLVDPKLPRFTNILSDTVVREGGTVALQVAVKGTPRAEVTWYRGSKPLPKKSSRFRYLEDAGVYSLVMTDASVTEAGTYVCRASNAHGYRDTSVNVEIVDSYGSSGSTRGKPAMFVSRPDTSMSIAVGEDVSVSFRVSGDPKPRVTWMKGMKDITNNIRTLKETINDYVRLTLKHATVVDAGTYFVMAKNIYGADHAFVTVRVKQRARSLTPTRSNIWSGPDTSTILRDIHESTRALVKDVPGPISSEPVVSDSGKNWLSLSWGKPEHRGAAPVLAYRVESWLLGTEGGAQWTELGVTPINSFDVFFLKPGSEYKFRITARNRYGWGESLTSTEPIPVGNVANFPPDIVRDLPGPLKALQGDNVTLECEISGDPPPTIQWLRDGQNVGTLSTLKDRVFVSDDQLIHRLIVKQLTEDDSGRYVCEAVNKLGRASTYARLLVVTDPRLLDADRKLKESLAEHQESAPQFTMRLRDRRVQESYPVRLSCQVIGSPTPSVTWARQGQPITADDRHQIVPEADHFHTLEITRTLLEDSGEYTAMAQNCLGAVSCHCQLIVDKGIRAYISPDFTSELSPAVTVREGAELRLFAQVEAYPTVSISWQRDGVRLRPSRRLVMTLDPEGRVELALAHLTVKDAGLYTCTATNAVGRAETVCQVFITGGAPAAAGVPTITTSTVPYSKEPRFVTKPRSSEAVGGDTVVITCEVVGDPQPEVMYSKEPRFVTKPRSSEAVEGDTVVITCEVVGDPQPEVMWLRDWLKPGYYRDAPQFRQVAGGSQSQYCLEIPQVKLDFTGTYCVIARNPHGEAKAIISLQIYAKGQGKESSMVSGHVKHGQVETLPEIKRELKDLRCCDGDAVTLECLVTATPLPSVRWEKDGKILPLGEDIEAELDGEIARLTIKKVYPEDEGQYSCVAYNDLGRAVTSACLVVDVPEEKETLLSQQLTRPPGLLSARSTPRSTPRNTPSPARSISPTPARYREFSSPSFSRPKRVKMSSPKFYTVPHNRIAEEGETVRFQCSVAGHPTPWASWDKDGHIVTPSTRLSVTERDDLRTLELREVTVEDAGLYRVTLENEMGSVEATARLDIIGRQGSRTRSVRAWSGVRSSPTFGRRLVGSAARVGGTFTLTCDVHASPSPVTSWYRNGEMLVKSPRVVPSWDGRRARLELRCLQPEDAGVYTCVAENAVGTTQCSADLRVLQTTDPSDADLQPPVFLQGLPPEQTAAEGQPFELQVRLQGSSPLEVVWVKDGVEVPDCPDLHHVDYGDGRFGLRIADVFVADGGIYNCEAFNDHGDAITSGHLIVNDMSGGEGGSTEPEIVFTKTPSPVLARLRGQASFCARLPSHPLSHTSFTWTVNGRSVNNDDRFTVTTEEDCSILHVGEVCPCDLGAVVCTARVCSPGVPPTIVSCDTTLGLDPSPGAPAVLLRGPNDTTAMRGDRVLLKATYRGDPEPSVRWLKAGRELNSEGRVQITSRDGVSCLTISAIDADDSGKYVVSVENIHGADCHFASVAVEGPPEAPAARPSVSVAGEGCVTVAWSSPPYDGGCVITGYRVEMRTALSHQWSVVADRCHSLSHVVRGLTPGQTYLFRVRAENIHGASESSAESFPFMLQSPHADLREEEGDGDGDGESDEVLEPRLVSLEPGEQFLERYSVHEELGKGRYGVVHKVTDVRTGHTMAAKFVRCIKKQDREKVQEEIDIMNCLRHPKLLQLAAAFENPKDMVMVMEYISGGELFERVVADDFTLTERDCILFLRQICEGVRYMHTCNVVHLDLKPENIMCHTRTSHRVKIIDFGLAQKLQTNTPVRVLFGTPEFIPPEIINYEPIGVESDMWSVGVICYVLLSGLSPFMGDNDAETFANITRADFDFDDEAFEAISQDAKDFISSLLIKRKEKRLTAEECLKHKWLTQSDTTMSSVKLCTDKLKKFIIRRKWQPLPRNERQIA